MTYKKNINQEERRIRELAATLKSNLPVSVNEKASDKTPERNGVKNIEMSTDSGSEIKSDIIKVSVIAVAILGTQIVVGLTSF